MRSYEEGGEDYVARMLEPRPAVLALFHTASACNSVSLAAGASIDYGRDMIKRGSGSLRMGLIDTLLDAYEKQTQCRPRSTKTIQNSNKFVHVGE
jgi:hypothetical protein